MFHQFRENGIYHIAYTLEDVTDRPGAVVEYSFEGTQLVFNTIDTPTLPVCEDPVATYQVELLANGNLRYRLVKDTCRQRAASTVGDHVPVR